MISLPQELIETIVDILHDDIGSLKACAFVSRAWNHRSRIHLLHKGVVLNLQDATVGPPNFEKATKDRVTAFQRLLSTQPAMIEHVQSFEIRNLVWRLSDEWTNLLVEIIQALRHIRQLTFRKVRWYFISDALQKGFMATLRLPTLVSINFHKLIMSDPSTLASLLVLPPNLQDMRISKFRCTDNSGEITIASGHGKHLHPLRSLSVDAGSTIQEIPLLQSLFGEDKSPYNLKSLRHLRVSETCPSNAARLLFEVSLPTIEEFEIIGASPSPHTLPVTLMVPLRRLPCLRRLVIPRTFLQVLLDPTYSSLDERHGLKDICIKSVDVSSLTLDTLTDLDAALAQAAFGALRRVELQVSGRSWIKASKGVLLGRFRKSKERGVEISVIKETKDRS
ncbi:hypothetical protein FPV67DRAFT_1171449 [Lyophyllum atratum]|nr:hypothetical protein FPV67DRAFT_1171449 [Lyophyllum atratum]